MKKALSFFLSLLFVILNVQTVWAENIITYENTETIVRGVTITHVQEYNTTHNLSYHYVVADLTEPHLKFEFLKNEDAIDRLETMSTLAETAPGVVSAINADFFSAEGSGLGFSTGIEWKDGELLQNPIEPDKMATGILDENGSLSFSYLEFSSTLEKKDGTIVPIRHTNKHTTWLADVLLYTSNWGSGMSPAPGGNAIEIVVENDIVTDIRRGDVSVPIPKNGYVLLTDEWMNQSLSDIEVGDKLRTHISVSPDLEGAAASFGGGTILVKDGKTAEFTHTVTGYNPRSAIGTNKDGTKIYLVAVDGRQKKSRGMTQNELANLMIKLGCYHAMNLDGGGSTRLLAASAESDYLGVANSPTENRKVINAVGISSSAERGSSVRLDATPPQEFLLLGDTLTMEAALYDKYDHDVSDGQSITWVLDGTDGKVKGNEITPTKTGTAVLRAKSGRLSSNKVEFSVIDSIAGITLPDSLSLEIGKTYLPKISVFTGNGQSFTVHTLAPFLLDYDPEFLKVENGKIVGLKDGVTNLTFSYGDVKTTVKVLIGSGEDTTRLNQNQYSDSALSSKDSGYNFRVGAMNKENTCLGILTGSGMEELLSQGDKAALLGAPLDRTANGKRIATDSFHTLEENNCLFISLDLSKGNLSGQWDSFTDIMKTSSASNVFILFETPLSSWDSERTVFEDYLSQFSGDKNIAVISPGDRNTLNMKGGVRYFTLIDSTKGSDAYDSITSLQILSFSINGNEVTYRFIPYYQN